MYKARMDYHANTNQKKTSLAVLIPVHVDSGKIDFKAKTLLLRKKDIFLKKKGPNHQEEITVLNPYIASKHIWQKLPEPKEVKKLTMISET